MGVVIANLERQPLSPHLHAALVARLRLSDLAGLSADEAFATLTADKSLLGLRLLTFVPQAKYDRTPERKRVVWTVVPGTWPGGVPGFPNLIRRPWFDAAWQEARGG